ncbi:MAG: hypothetical protein ACYC27_12225 [Armatimonadota bacterium]
MISDKKITTEEANVLHKEAADASIERDIAVYTAVRASGREAEAIEDAKVQKADANIALKQAIGERDVALDAMTQAAGREAIAKNDAREQHTEAFNAQASAIRASEREAAARDDAREQHVEALNAQAEAASMNTLRNLANGRADSEARGGDRARFVLYLMSAITFAVFVVGIGWLYTR